MGDLSVWLLGAIMISSGIWAVWFRKKDASYTAKMSKDVYGIAFKERFYEMAFLIGGLVMTLFGVAILLKHVSGR